MEVGHIFRVNSFTGRKGWTLNKYDRGKLAYYLNISSVLYGYGFRIVKLKQFKIEEQHRLIVWYKPLNCFQQAMWTWKRDEFQNKTGNFPYGFRIVKLK